MSDRRKVIGHEVADGFTLLELFKAVLAAGRIGGGDAATEIWHRYVVAWRWDETATRNHCRLLRKHAEGDLVDEKTAELVTEFCAVALKLASHGLHMGSPREISEWFKAATDRKRDPGPLLRPEAATAAPATPRRPFLHTTKEEFYRQLIAGDKPKGKKR